MEGYVYNSNTQSTYHLNEDDAIAKLTSCGQTFSDEQLSILRTKGSMVVISCAGSGKTHTLINLTAKRVLTGEITDQSKVLLTTFSRAGKDNMNTRLSDLFQRVGLGKCDVVCRTMHSVYYSFLTKCFNRSKLSVIGETERNNYIRKAATANWKNSVTEDEISDLSALLSFQINNLADLGAIYNSYMFNLDMPLETFTKIHADFYTNKRTDDVMDFDDMQFNTYWFLYKAEEPHREMYKSWIRQYTDIYVDEFQDTSKVQYAILKQLITDPNKCLFIGDDDQCIYEWRGSDPRILMNLVGDFPGITKMYLSTNYRCKQDILEFAKTGIPSVTLREAKNMESANPDGEVEFLYCDCKDLCAMSISTADKIEELQKQGTKLNDIAVLTRNNGTLHLLEAELIDRNIWTSSEPRTQIHKSSYYKDMCALADLCSPLGTGLRNRHLAKSLTWKIVMYLGSKNTPIFVNLMDATGCSLLEAVGYVLYSRNKITEEESLPVELNYRQRVQLGTQIRNLSELTVASLKELWDNLQIKDPTEQLNKLMTMYHTGMGFTAKKASTQRQHSGYYKYFKHKLAQKGYTDFKLFLDLIKVYEESEKLAYGPTVTLSTIHGAKGLEWKNVFLFGYDNFTFPDIEYITSETDKGQDMTVYLDGERRLAYVGATRAIDKLFIVTDNKAISYLGLEQLGLNKYVVSSTRTNDVLSFFYTVQGNSMYNPEGIIAPVDKIHYCPPSKHKKEGQTTEE